MYICDFDCSLVLHYTAIILCLTCKIYIYIYISYIYRYICIMYMMDVCGGFVFLVHYMYDFYLRIGIYYLCLNCHKYEIIWTCDCVQFKV